MKKIKMNEEKLIILKVANYLTFIASVIIIIMGGMLNHSVIISNGCKMPVYTDEINFSNSKSHFSFTDKNAVNNFYLSDIFKIKIKNFLAIFSIGDFVVLLGFTFSIMSLVKKIKLNRRIKKNVRKEKIK